MTAADIWRIDYSEYADGNVYAHLSHAASLK